MAGNYGGSSIPTTPIAGGTLLTGKATTYANYMCTSVLSIGASATFTYKGVVIPMATVGSKLDLIIEPRLLEDAHAQAIFLCYDCSCDSTMSGTTAPSSVTYSGAQMYAPTIIGGEGLNS